MRNTKSSRRVQEEANSRPDRPFHIQPKTHNQSLFLNAIRSHSISVGIGPAGTGKTFIAASMAASLVGSRHYDTIVLTRPNVSTGKTLGYFSGNSDEKLTNWLQPALSELAKRFPNGKMEYKLQKKEIVLQPLETIRGASFDRSVVLVDEAQNLSMEEIKALVTRPCESSKLIMTGDPTQSDVKRGSDLVKFLELCKRNQIEIPVVQFGLDDIVRSDLVAQLVRMFYKEGI
jgi:phosphate starvation-inducible PhoH-like protein